MISNSFSICDKTFVCLPQMRVAELPDNILGSSKKIKSKANYTRPRFPF